MVAAVRKSKQVVQIGMQRRSAPAVMAAKKLVDDGVLGRITLVKPQWHWNVARPLNNTPLPGKIDWDRFLGNAPKRPLEPMRFRYWRYFWDYAGGNMTDQGTHLMDVVLWFTNSAPPKSAVCWGYVAKMTGRRAPRRLLGRLRDGQLTWPPGRWTTANSFQNGWSITFMGDKGTMILDEWGYRVWAEPWKPENPPIHQEQAPVPIENHVQNFLDCIKFAQGPQLHGRDRAAGGGRTAPGQSRVSQARQGEAGRRPGEGQLRVTRHDSRAEAICDTQVCGLAAGNAWALSSAVRAADS